ncbi:glycerol-3-phosphate acyltransferase [Clostridium celatum]|uniref:Glycerol-3-phosphate acyltransferase n=1 Tax=Clostridium celatum DSM 1785 TaxID=545697 RepID=L1QK22_9CLOT|nr:glycerol-3-phosphate acyltransferase [Clostridium celatum]EKY28308.1 putative acyl-phosphate glycerol 3-phosphate acyltransferase [Clostridium celatum DSM 1785]MCE9655288.1 glycerol-3-phosphate acyltransferase [Clostridium celatum]MDU2265490.1 glycerol-3-phosphate acyltransferase [Clostridium celatum]MDU3723791.1 glycerol-3-phosphate acyltransferase [Clostridium celatum]MDU6295220.1 glycerol-3-phosphate acyltransferase [Clostridium celatum]
MILLKEAFLIFISFLSGSIMYSYIIPKLFKNIDIREISEDSNPGAGNVIKNVGFALGILCVILDVLKAFIPVYISINKFNVDGILLVLIAIAPILGHAFSPFLNYNGGKAISSTFGSFLALYPLSNISIIFAIILIFFKFILTIKPNSSVILASTLLLDIIIFIYDNNFYIKLISLFTSFILIYKHEINRNYGDISISLFNKYFKFTLNNFNNKKIF